MIEITPEEQNKEKGMKRIEDSLRDIWDNIKCTNIQIRGSRRRREKVIEVKVTISKEEMFTYQLPV